MTVFPLHLKIGSLTLGLDYGDLFEADADAIVNSEQTDFFLSGNPHSISGQIYHRYGDRIQEELDAAVDALADGGNARIDAEGGRPVLDPPVTLAFTKPRFLISPRLTENRPIRSSVGRLIVRLLIIWLLPSKMPEKLDIGSQPLPSL